MCILVSGLFLHLCAFAFFSLLSCLPSSVLLLLFFLFSMRRDCLFQYFVRSSQACVWYFPTCTGCCLCFGIPNHFDGRKKHHGLSMLSSLTKRQSDWKVVVLHLRPLFFKLSLFEKSFMQLLYLLSDQEFWPADDFGITLHKRFTHAHTHIYITWAAIRLTDWNFESINTNLYPMHGNIFCLVLATVSKRRMKKSKSHFLSCNFLWCVCSERAFISVCMCVELDTIST